MKRFSQARFSFVWICLLLGLVCFVLGCAAQQPAALVVTPSIGEPKVGAPSPQQPGEEIGISIEIASTGGATLSYTWTADGGEIVRGQGSPAITYRVPKDPGTYNIRVKVEWDGQSVEKVTSVKVEGPASESTPEPPTDTPEPPADTPTPKPTDTPTSANTPKPPVPKPTIAATPISTPTPKETNIPINTPLEIWNTGRSGCMDIPNSVSENGNLIQVYECHGGNNQRWFLTSEGEIRDLGKRCLDVRDSQTTNGSLVQLFDCNGQSNQRWKFTSRGEIRGLDDKCLDAGREGWNGEYSTQELGGSPLQLYECNERDYQKWLVTPKGR